MERARKVLFWLRDGTTSREAITHELHAISADVESRHASASSASASASTSITSSPFIALTLSLFREPALFARLWRAFLLQFMAQMCGATAMKYYLPALLKALGVETRVALMAGALEMTLKIGMTVLEMWVIDRFGRRACLVGGSLVMGVAMLVRSDPEIPQSSSGVQRVAGLSFRSTERCRWRSPAMPTRSQTWFA